MTPGCCQHGTLFSCWCRYCGCYAGASTSKTLAYEVERQQRINTGLLNECQKLRTCEECEQRVNKLIEVEKVRKELEIAQRSARTWQEHALVEQQRAEKAEKHAAEMREEYKLEVEWAIKLEREACAKILDDGRFLQAPGARWARQVAKVIRARGKK